MNCTALYCNPRPIRAVNCTDIYSEMIAIDRSHHMNLSSCDDAKSEVSCAAEYVVMNRCCTSNVSSFHIAKSDWCHVLRQPSCKVVINDRCFCVSVPSFANHEICGHIQWLVQIHPSSCSLPPNPVFLTGKFAIFHIRIWKGRLLSACV